MEYGIDSVSMEGSAEIWVIKNRTLVRTRACGNEK